MPPKQTITIEMIVDVAFILVRKQGISALSARNIAKALNCSTQPVYSCFSTMASLEKIVIQRAAAFVQNALDKMGCLVIKNKLIEKGVLNHENNGH